MKFYFLGLLLALSACAHAPADNQALTAIDVPTGVNLGYVSGMIARIETDHTFKILIYGETEAHGGIRLTPLIFGRVAPEGETKITEQTVVIIERSPGAVPLRSYRGVLSCDSAMLRVQIKLEVKDGGVWHPFGWNGKWPLVVASVDD